MLVALAFLLQLAPLPAPSLVLALEGETHHVQGILVDGGGLWVTAVDRERREAILFQFDIATGRRMNRILLAREPYFHPGGLDGDGESLWIPLAEYRPGGRSIIERRSKKDLSVLQRFEAPDHIGCVALLAGRLYGANWDAQDIYEWSLRGEFIRKRSNPTGYRFQDLKGRAGRLVGAGMAPKGSDAHAIVWLDPAQLAVWRTLPAGATSRGVPFVNEGLDVTHSHLYLLPEDTPSRLFVWELGRLTGF